MKNEAAHQDAVFVAVLEIKARVGCTTKRPLVA